MPWRRPTSNPASDTKLSARYPRSRSNLASSQADQLSSGNGRAFSLWRRLPKQILLDLLRRRRLVGRAGRLPRNWQHPCNRHSLAKNDDLLPVFRPAKDLQRLRLESGNGCRFHAAIIGFVRAPVKRDWNSQRTGRHSNPGPFSRSGRSYIGWIWSCEPNASSKAVVSPSGIMFAPETPSSPQPSAAMTGSPAASALSRARG